ncbi:MAG: DEAD/DEAH box helicase family protein [Desulfosoma sp.]
MTRTVYRKLVRDNIPDLIRREGKTPCVVTLSDEAFKDALALKLLEEAHEFFRSWRAGNPREVLKESADLLEVILAALEAQGLRWEDLLREREERRAQRGAFLKRLFLQWVGEDPSNGDVFEDVPDLIIGPLESDRLVRLIKSEIARSKAVSIASAFFSPAVMNLMLRDFTEFLDRGHDLRIIVSTMGNMIPPEHLVHLKNNIPKIRLRIYHPADIPYDQNPPNFHVKVYLFHRLDGTGAFLIGSSNFTQAGLCTNVEWNYFSAHEINLPFAEKSAFSKALQTFDQYWEKYAVEPSEEFLQAYRRRFQESRRAMAGADEGVPGLVDVFFTKQKAFRTERIPRIQANEAQQEALRRLDRLRRHGVSKAAVIAATGVGKTYLAAMDFKQSGAKRLLFVAHRENILDAALRSFRRVLGDEKFGVLYGGGNHAHDTGDSLFAMIQTLSREDHLGKFPREAFDYMVVDEFHHAMAPSYLRVVEYFRPKFLLGLTATPERMDGRDVLALCEGHVAYELRLLEAIDRGLLCPFHYFAIYDPVDYEQITWRGTHYDPDELTEALKNDTRTAILARNLKRYLPSFGKVKALAFCSSVAHARYTAHMLNTEHGIGAATLTGESPEEERSEAIRRLRDESDPLQVLCVVDIFNEGVDIPELTHVLFLRPTLSFTVFLQQLGRGLRRVDRKEFVVVIDFVGNFRRAHVAPLALQGFASEEEFAEAVRNGVPPVARLPKGCFLDIDTPVRRLWDEEIRKILRGQLGASERLKLLYLEIKEDLGGKSPSLVDLVANSRGVDPQRFIHHFNGWLRTKLYCEEDLSAFEKSLLDTPGEAFLLHLEKDLHPTKSYKMVVLKSLLKMPGTRWAVEDIARRFLDYYVRNPDKAADYEELARHGNPGEFPLKKVVSKLKSMPLHYLSNTEKDFFIFDKTQGKFELKAHVIPYWKDQRFRQMVEERVEYGLIRYFQRLRDESENAPSP